MTQIRESTTLKSGYSGHIRTLSLDVVVALIRHVSRPAGLGVKGKDEGKTITCE